MLLRAVLVMLAACMSVLTHAADSNSSTDITEKALMQSPAYGDIAFFMGQARRIRGLQPLEFDPAPLFQRREKTGMGLEVSLWKMRNIDIAQGVPQLRMMFPDIGFNPERADGLLRAGPRMKDLFDAQAEQVTAVMSEGAGCQPGFDVSALGPPAYEYLVTHQLFAAFWSYQRGCITAEAYRVQGGRYATRIYHELLTTKNNPLSDLQVERMALLCLFRLCNAIPTTLIDRLREARGADGLWRFTDSISPDMINYEHGTFLAYFTLVARGEWR